MFESSKMPKGIYLRSKRWTKFSERITRRAISLYDERGFRLGRIAETLDVPKNSVQKMLRGEKYPHLKSALFDGTRLLPPSQPGPASGPARIFSSRAGVNGLLADGNGSRVSSGEV